VNQHVTAHQKAIQSQEEEKEKHNEKKRQIEKTVNDFNNSVDHSHDLNDMLPELNNLLLQHTNSTAVYIGKLVQPLKKIKDSDNDKAHIIKDAPKHIHFIHADKAHDFLIDRTLMPGVGVTFEVLEDKPIAKIEEEGEEGATESKPEVKSIFDGYPQHLVVPEVVRDPRVHFYKVPRLGSYMAIRLEYNTCLFEEAFDAGVLDLIEVNERLRIQEEERANFERMEEERKAQADADGEVFKPDNKEWPKIETKPYLTKKV